MLPATAFEVANLAYNRGKEQREAGRLGDARQTVACLAAFSKTLARSDPSQAAFHKLVSLAFEQEAKNAWEVNDYTTIQAALSNALGEACTALRLDPQDANARLKVAGLQDKLFKLASDRPSAP